MKLWRADQQLSAEKSSFVAVGLVKSLLMLLAILDSVGSEALTNDEKLENMEKIKLSPKEYKDVERMHYSWYQTATNALLGAVGRELYLRMSRENRRAFVECLDNIKEDLDIKSGARCITAALDNRLIKQGNDFPEHKGFIESNGDEVVHELQGDFLEDMSFAKLIAKHRKGKQHWSSPIKPMKRRDKLRKLREGAQQMERRLFKRHHDFRIDGQIKEMMEESKRLDRLNPSIKILTMDKPPSLIDSKAEFMKLSRSPIWTASKLLTNFFRALNNKTAVQPQPWKTAYKKMEKMQELIEESKTQSERRMLDVVLGDKNPYRRKKTLGEKLKGYLPKGERYSPLMKTFFKLVDSFAKHNGEGGYKFLSPRFFPVVADNKGETRHALSPNFFPMYNDDSPHSILPVPEVLKATGMSEQDSDAVLELIMQTSGARSIVDETLKVLDSGKLLGLDEDITDITKFIRRIFSDLEKTLSSRQKREINSRKYTFLSKDQLALLFGSEGVYNTTEFPFDLDEYASWTEEEKKNALFQKIRVLAEETEPEHHSRQKRQTTLSPFAFSPSVLGIALLELTLNGPCSIDKKNEQEENVQLSVLAPVTLSPSLFSPSVLNPYLLSPPVLSPQLGNPMIFSPYVLGPNVLSAAVFSVYVFSPYVLSPNVINPYVMSPMILSPYVLCPDILSPTVLSGVVLSPSVLSPSVLSDNAITLQVLSPSFLS